MFTLQFLTDDTACPSECLTRSPESVRSGYAPDVLIEAITAGDADNPGFTSVSFDVPHEETFAVLAYKAKAGDWQVHCME